MARGGAALSRFLARVERDESSGCLNWRGYVRSDGYGSFWADGRKHVAHRWAYRTLVGEVAAELTIDHLCRNRRCVNTAHLEPVSRGENVLRGVGIAAMRARQTECSKGHPLDEENTYRWGSHRQCLTCRRANSRKWWAENHG